MKTLKSSNFLLMAFNIPQKIELPEVTYVRDGDGISVGTENLTFISAPGHTPGSCILQLGNSWFTGDTIYSKGTGLSSIPGANNKILKKTISDLWEDLTANIILYPGHGGISDGASIRKHNHALRKFIELES